MTTLQDLRNEVRAKPALGIGLGLIAVLALAYAYGFANQARNNAAQAYLEDVAELQKIKLLAQQKDWPQRAKDAQALQSGLQAAIPRSDSIGLAQATQAAWLRSAILPFAPRVNVVMGQPTKVDGLAGYWKVPADINAQVNAARAVQILQRVEGTTNLMYVQSLRIVNTASPGLQMSVVAYYRIVRGAERQNGA
jgi:hypothetical protein